MEYGFRSERRNDEDDEDDAGLMKFHTRDSGRTARTTRPLKEPVRRDPIGIVEHGLKTTGTEQATSWFADPIDSITLSVCADDGDGTTANGAFNRNSHQIHRNLCN